MSLKAKNVNLVVALDQTLKIRGSAKFSGLPPVGPVNVSIKFWGNPSESCADISVKLTELHF